MLPVIDNSSAIIKSAELAIQYAPDAPTSLITAITGLFKFLTESAISLDATTVPPGEFISRITAFILPSSFAFFNSFKIEVTLEPVCSNGNPEDDVEIIP